MKEIKAVVKEKGYTGFTVCRRLVYFKKLDFVPIEKDLDKKTDCTLWIYDPSKEKKASQDIVALGKTDALKNFIKSTPFAKTDLTELMIAIQKQEINNKPIKYLKSDDIF